MGVLNDFHHQQLWIEHPVFFRYHAPCDSQNGTEESQIKQNGPMRCYLEMNDKIWVDDRCEHKDCCK